MSPFVWTSAHPSSRPPVCPFRPSVVYRPVICHESWKFGWRFPSLKHKRLQMYRDAFITKNDSWWKIPLSFLAFEWSDQVPRKIHVLGLWIRYPLLFLQNIDCWHWVGLIFKHMKCFDIAQYLVGYFEWYLLCDLCDSNSWSDNKPSQERTEISFAIALPEMFLLLSFLLYELTLISTRINNHMSHKVWDEITYPFPKRQQCDVVSLWS